MNTLIIEVDLLIALDKDYGAEDRSYPASYIDCLILLFVVLCFWVCV